MNTTQITSGTEIEFRGDMANDPFKATVTKVEGHYFWFQTEAGAKHGPEPVGLLSTPRWRVSAGR